MIRRYATGRLHRDANQRQSTGRRLWRGRLEYRSDAGHSPLDQSATLAPLNGALQPLLSRTLGEAAVGSQHPPTVVDMGIRWLIVQLDHADACRAWSPDAAAIKLLQHDSGTDGLVVYGAYQDGGAADYEVRAMAFEHGILIEDLVTGSANACIPRLLAASRQGNAYRARQGTALGRAGNITLSHQDGIPWIGGYLVKVIDGEIRLPG